MAYHSTSGTANNTADFFSKLKSFVIDTVGWTILSSDLAVTNPFLYISSTGESGKETINLLLDKFTANADKICVRTALWWNPDTSSAVLPPCPGPTYPAVSIAASNRGLHNAHRFTDTLALVLRQPPDLLGHRDVPQVIHLQAYAYTPLLKRSPLNH